MEDLLRSDINIYTHKLQIDLKGKCEAEIIDFGDLELDPVSTEIYYKDPLLIQGPDLTLGKRTVYPNYDCGDLEVGLEIVNLVFDELPSCFYDFDKENGDYKV